MRAKAPLSRHSQVSFSKQLSTAFVSGIFFLAIVSSLAISWVVSTTARRYFIEQGIQLTHQFAAQSKLALLFGSKENAELPAKTLLAFPDVLHVAIYDLDHKLLLSKGSASKTIDQSWLKKIGDMPKLIDDSSAAWYFMSEVVRTPDPDLVDSPFSEDEPHSMPLGYVTVTLGKGSLHGLMERIFIVNTGIALALASVLMLILRVITKRLTMPIERLSDIMSRAHQGETGIRADLYGPKDVVVMEQAFNKMMSVIEKRQAQLQAARDEALETARIKAEFAAVVSHEIRTPLNGVLGMLNLLNAVGVPEKQQQYLDVAVQSGDALLDLINDILDFSKIDAGKLELENIDFNLRTCLEDALILFTERAKNKNIEPCLAIPEDLPVTVKADQTRLRQVLNNLLSNAIKFTDEGEILLSVSWVNDESGKGLFTFSVKDTGVGIPFEAQKKIFESFSQADSSTTRKYGGSGLGLTICRQLIDLLGGRLGVESKPGQGSNFSFDLQLEIIEYFEKKSLYPDKTCMIVDSNHNNRAYLSGLISSLGCRCFTLAGERELFQNYNSRVWTQLPFDMLLFNLESCESNLNMFAERARGQEDGLARRLVMMVSPTITKYDESKVDATLNTPVRYEQLRRCLDKQLSVSNIDEKFSSVRGAPLRNSNSYGQILVVDDNRTNQLVAKAMLNELGFLADVAADGREALNNVARKRYDLILMDCNMPNMDGFEATQRIRALEGKAGLIPIFAMTATDNPKDIKRCLDIGMDDFLSKPLTLEVLRQTLNNEFQLDKNKKRTSAESRSGRTDTIDPDSFANLENAMGNRVSEIVDAFLTDSPGYLAGIQKAMNDQKWGSAADVAHGLKGSARNVGANLFASVCREIEELSRGDALTIGRAKELFSDLRTEYRKVEAALSDKLAERVRSKRKCGPGEGEVILVVDDDRSTRMSIANSLEPEGLYIDQAVNGREAVEKFGLIKPDLVIMDAVMPVMDGFEASMKIKSTEEGRKTPILIVTALENDASIERAFKSGAADFIPKPVNLAVLRRRVKRVLDARQSEQRVERLAYIDGLTGLPNRVAFSDRLTQDLAYAKRNNKHVAVMFVDIDHFKDVNDSLGHAAGDELLKVIAGRIGSCVRSEDTLARLGGDEFVLVLSSINGPKGADIAAKHLLKSLSSPFRVVGRELFVGASIGISIFPEDGTDRETLLKNADTAMYRAKASGRNNYQFYTREMSASISDRVEMETDLRTVLHKDELCLYYQPKAEATTGEIVGAEALIRWRHPSRGFLAPNSFIPLAEEIGVLDDIGGWVMNTACGQFQDWYNRGNFDASVAINVSATQLMASGFVDNVEHSLKEAGFDPGKLELEITENAILEHADDTIEKLKKLSLLGVKVALDDFGVGYSSFSYLKRFPVNILKIDRSFIQDITEDTSGAAIIDGMIKLAHNLNLQVVAEGVETTTQYDLLKELGCDIVQGFFISKPLSTELFYNQFVAKTANRRVLASE